MRRLASSSLMSISRVMGTPARQRLISAMSSPPGHPSRDLPRTGSPTVVTPTG
jgi:hypothetical protein